jgi:hypothetical protein
MAHAQRRQRELYLQWLQDYFPWASSDQLSTASKYLADVMQSAVVEKSTTFNQEAMEFAEERGRHLAEMLGKAPAIARPLSR